MKEDYPFLNKLNIEIINRDAYSATGRIKVTEDMTDYLGHVTGGIYNSLADAIGGAAARAAGDIYVTQNCSMQFYKSTELSDEYLYAEAVIRHRGSRTCIAAVTLRHEDGIIVSDGQFSYSKI